MDSVDDFFFSLNIQFYYEKKSFISNYFTSH